MSKANVPNLVVNATLLTPTAVKSTAYTATPSDFIPVDVSSGSVTITLPTTPIALDKSRVGIKMIAASGSNTVTIAAGGSDVFNKAGGSTSLTLSLLNQGMLLQYTASTGIWYVQSDDLALSQLDNRYTSSGGGPLGSANNPVTNPSATRPTSLPVVFWQSTTQPTNWAANDIWLKI